MGGKHLANLVLHHFRVHRFPQDEKLAQQPCLGESTFTPAFKRTETTWGPAWHAANMSGVLPQASRLSSRAPAFTSASSNRRTAPPHRSALLMTGLLFAHEQALTPRDNYLLTFPRNLSTGITARRSFEYMTEPVGAAVLSSPSPLRAESAELLRDLRRRKESA